MWIRPYAANKPARIMSPLLRRKVLSQFPSQEGRIRMPIEMVAGELVFDRQNSKGWREVRIRELLARTDGPGLAVLSGHLHWVQPIDSKTMLAFTNRRFERYWGVIFRELGPDKYLNRSLRTVPRSLISEAKVQKSIVRTIPLEEKYSLDRDPEAKLVHN